MFEDYEKYLTFVEQEPVFNKSLFIEKKQKKKKIFIMKYWIQVYFDDLQKMHQMKK